MRLLPQASDPARRRVRVESCCVRRLRGSLGALVLGALLSQPFSPELQQNLGLAPELQPNQVIGWPSIERPIPRPSRTRVSRSQPRPAPEPRWTYVRSREAILRCIRKAEGSSWTSVSPSGKYRNAYQMSWAFFIEYGGDPAYAGRWEHAPKWMQNAVAWRGYKARGFSPWPPAMRRCRVRF